MDNKHEKIRYAVIFCVIFLAGSIIRLLCADFVTGDMRGCLLPWYEELRVMDLKTALTTQVGNYNMLYQLIIYCMTKIPFEPMYLYKILSVVFDVALAFGVYAWLVEIADKKRALIGFAATFLLPTVWLNSAAWGQCDSIYVSFIIWSLLMLYRRKYIPSFVLLGFALAFKLQAVFILPFYGCVYLSRFVSADDHKFSFKLVRWKKNEISILHFLIVPLVHIATALPNFIAGRPIYEVFSIYLDQADQYHRMVMNCSSFWAAAPISYEIGKYSAIALSFLILGFMIIQFLRCGADIMGKHFLSCAFFLSYTCFLFLPAMHERYGFIHEILIVLLVVNMKKGWKYLAAIQLITLYAYCRYLGGYADVLKVSLPKEIFPFLTLLNLFVFFTLLSEFDQHLRGIEEGARSKWYKDMIGCFGKR
ncbi:MAG: DUF2029 domain-containing protein [Ruminococcaceae bacterium]|nr:DUF2029 domain-containing protein [Oscillospiraceae bacterium]